MILLKIEDSIQFTPESDMDCFNLGGLCKQISCILNFNRDSPNPSVAIKLTIVIKESDLLTYLFK